MIVASDWIWLHFPKCAGTSTEKTLRMIFRGNQSINFDPKKQENVIWHHTLHERQEYDPTFSVGSRRVICNIRRLPFWVLSRVHFEVQRRGKLGAVTRDQLVEGRFATPQPGGSSRIHLADQIASRFAEGVTDWVRVENMAVDLANALGLKSDQVQAEMVRENTGKLSYIKNLPFWFSQSDLDRMYAANPVWADLERRIYGDTVKI